MPPLCLMTALCQAIALATLCGLALTYSRWLARAVARPLAPAYAGRRLRVDPVQLQARLHEHVQLRSHASATAHRDRQGAPRDQDRRPAADRRPGTQHEVLHFNVSSATNKTAWPQMLGVTVDFIDSDTGMAGLYNHTLLRTPTSLEFAATADSPSPSGAR